MEEYTVVEPVVNLLKVPQEGPPSYSHDDMLETQLLFNERILVTAEEKGWFFVEAVEQEIFRKHGRWQGYPGWVPAYAVEPVTGGRDTRIAVVKERSAPVFGEPSDKGDILLVLPIGTKVTLAATALEDERFLPVEAGRGRYGWIDKGLLREPGRRALDEARVREEVLATTRAFLGTPYLWGGRSIHMPGFAAVSTGVDCSGLVNLVFRVHGIDLPRDAHEQWMRAERVTPDILKPSDLIFLGPKSGDFSHVMIFAGGEHFVEAVETGGYVRSCTFGERLGVGLAGISGLHRPGDTRRISFGRVLLCP